jgi:Pathogenicity locus
MPIGRRHMSLVSAAQWLICPRHAPCGALRLSGMSERELRHLLNIGVAMARTLVRLGIRAPGDLLGQNPAAL